MSSSKKVKTLVLELTDRQKSQYMLQGSEGSGMPLHIDAPSNWRLPLRSTRFGPDGKYETIRYIKGCDTISEKEQKSLGVEPNSLQDNVYFENGVLSVVGEGSFESLYEYLRQCEWNESNEKRPKTARTFFREINTEKRAEESLDTLDDYSDSLNVLKALRTKNSINEYEYDEPKMEALLHQFNVQAGSGPAEKLSALTEIAKSRPKWFMETIKSATASLRTLVMMARDMNVIAIDTTHISFTATGQKFHKFKSKDADERIGEIINHFMNPNNKTDLDRLATEVEMVQRATVAEA